MELYLKPSAYDAETRGWMLASLSPVARYAVKLYFRCQMFKEIALPEDGGVLEQSEFIVSMLESVHSEVMMVRTELMEDSYRPKPTVIEGVDSSLTENIHIGNNYSRRSRR